MTERWEPRPLPDMALAPETETYWTAAANGDLLLSECTDCDLVFHYPRQFCPDCSGTSVAWITADGTGTIYSYSVSHQAEDWPDEHLPLIVAFVELREGPRIMSNIVSADPEDVSVGQSVEAGFIQTDLDDIAIPVFRPIVSDQE